MTDRNERVQKTESHQEQAFDLLADALNGHRGKDQQAIAEEVLRWGTQLLKKNMDYGSSVWNHPVLAPDCSIDAAIRVRMSDKISRLKNLITNGQGEINESIDDTLRDLGSYCLLLLANPRRNE